MRGVFIQKQQSKGEVPFDEDKFAFTIDSTSEKEKVKADFLKDSSLAANWVPKTISTLEEAIKTPRINLRSRVSY